jgi:hypothetical protein
MTRFD